MTDWFRSWHGAPTDPKWVLIAKRAGVTPAIASAVAWALFDHASQAHPRGSVLAFDCEVYAAWGGLEDQSVSKVLEVMKDRGMIALDGMLAKWSKRQPEREDGSAERAKTWRENKRTQMNAGKQPCVDANAIDPHRDRTEVDTETEERENLSLSREVDPNWKKFAEAWPHHASWPEAEIEFAKVSGEIEEILAGVKRYLDSRFPDQQWADPAKWLAKRRWEDHPAPRAVPPLGSRASAEEKRKLNGKGFYFLQQSKNGEAWAAHAKKLGKSQVWDADGGWYFPAQWPPGHERALGAA